MTASRSGMLSLASSTDVIRTAPLGQLRSVAAHTTDGANSSAGSAGSASHAVSDARLRSPLATVGRERPSSERVNADFWEQRHMP